MTGIRALALGLFSLHPPSGCSRAASAFSCLGLPFFSEPAASAARTQQARCAAQAFLCAVRGLNPGVLFFMSFNCPVSTAFRRFQRQGCQGRQDLRSARQFQMMLMYLLAGLLFLFRRVGGRLAWRA